LIQREGLFAAALPVDYGIVLRVSPNCAAHEESVLVSVSSSRILDAVLSGTTNCLVDASEDAHEINLMASKTRVRQIGCHFTSF
jgi:hypothetical protein